MAQFADARHGFPPAGSLDLQRDPGVQGRHVCTALSWLSVRMNGLPAIERRVDASGGSRGVVDPDAPKQPSGGSTPDSPVALFCARPQGRINDEVNQGLCILDGLALGSSVGGRAQGQP
jgi:hypothetical protein